MSRMGEQMKKEGRQARHELLNWKNVLFGWSAYRGLFQTLRQSRDEIKDLLDRRNFQDGDVHFGDTFEQAARRYGVGSEGLQALEQSLRQRAAWWFLASTMGLVSLVFAPISPHPYLHGLAAVSLCFFTGARTVQWYFRACQVHDRELYGFRRWFDSNKLVKRCLTIALALAAITGILLCGRAYADPTIHTFTPDPNDPSVVTLRAVFGSMVDTIVGGGPPQGDTTDSAFGAMMVPFNTMVLTLAMLFVGYTTVQGIVAGAGSGTFMGKQGESTKWIVARTLGGVGFLVPLGSGYSLIQYTLMWWALQGAGAGNMINSAALDHMSTGKQSMIAQPQVPSASSFIKGVLQAKVCMAAMNKQYTDAQEPTRIQLVSSTYNLKPADQGFWGGLKGRVSYGNTDSQEHPFMSTLPILSGLHVITTLVNYNNQRTEWAQDHTYTAYRYSFDAVNSKYVNPEGVCGALNFSNPTSDSMAESSINQTIVTAQAQAVNSIINSPLLDQVANQIVNADGNTPPDANTRTLLQQSIMQLTDQYTTAVVNVVESSGGVSGISDADWQQFITTMKATGWAYLPSYFNQLIRANDNVQMALNAMPEFSYARVTAFESDMQLQNYKDAMTKLDEYTMTPTDLIMANAQKQGGIDLSKSWYADMIDNCIPKSADAEKAKAAAVGNSSIESSFEPIRNCLSTIPRRGIFQLTDSLMGGNLNHIVHIQALGNTIIDVGEGFLIGNFMVSGATSNAAGSALGIASAVQSLGGFVSTAVIMLLVFGAVAAFYIPLIPYIFGTIAFVKWITLVFESIIAGPVFMAAHVFPEGHDVTGRAGPGYMLLLGLFLRPALTVIGFYMSIVVAQPVSDYINITYGNAVMGASAHGVTGVVALIAYVAIYVSMMTTVMHSIYSLINWVPDNVLRWIGGSLQAHGIGDQEAGEMKGNVVAAFHGGHKIGTNTGSKIKGPAPKGTPKGGDGDGDGKPEFSQAELSTTSQNTSGDPS